MADTNASEFWRLLFAVTDALRENAVRFDLNALPNQYASVTVGQMRILKAIFLSQTEYPDGMMLKMLAEKVNLTPGAASVIVESLVKLGILDRKTSSTDRRAVSICLSGNGRKIIERYGRFYTEIAEELLTGVGQEDYAAMMRLLTHFHNILANKKGNRGAT